MTATTGNVTEVINTRPPLIRTISTHLLALAVGGALIGGGFYSGIIPNTNTATASASAQPTLETVTRTLNGKDANTNKLEATAALTKVLQAIARNADPNALGAEVAEGNYANVPTELKDNVVGGDETTRQATMVAVIYLAAGLGNTMGGAGNIKPISDQAVISTADALTEYGIVHIPQNIYTRTNYPVSVTMVWDTKTNSWKIDGHDLTIQELILALAKENAAAATATPTATTTP
jgi:hypothetical protein